MIRRALIWREGLDWEWGRGGDFDFGNEERRIAGGNLGIGLPCLEKSGRQRFFGCRMGTRK